MSWESDIEELHSRIGSGKYLNRDYRRPVPFPDALNLCSRNSNELFTHGSFDNVLEWIEMKAQSKQKWVTVMRKCHDRNRKQTLQNLAKQKDYFDKMDKQLRDKGLDPFKHLDQGSEVKSILKEMIQVVPFANVSLPEYDFPKKFPPHVQIISDLELANVEFRNDPNIPCLRCRPCAKQVASPEIIYSPEVPLAEEVDPKKAATIDALFDDFLDSSDEGDNPPPPIGAPPKFSPASPPMSPLFPAENEHEELPPLLIPPPQISPHQRKASSLPSPVQKTVTSSKIVPAKLLTKTKALTRMPIENEAKNESITSPRLQRKDIQILPKIPKKVHRPEPVPAPKPSKKHVLKIRKHSFTKPVEEPPTILSLTKPVATTAPSPSPEAAPKIPESPLMQGRRRLVLSNLQSLTPANGDYFYSNGMWRLENSKAAFEAEIKKTPEGWCIIGIARKKRCKLYQTPVNLPYPPNQGWRCVYKKDPNFREVPQIRFPDVEDRVAQPKKGRIRLGDSPEESNVEPRLRQVGPSPISDPVAIRRSFKMSGEISDDDDEESTDSESEDPIVIPDRKRKFPQTTQPPLQRKKSWTNEDVVYSDEEIHVKRRKCNHEKSPHRPAPPRQYERVKPEKRSLPDELRSHVEPKRLKKDPQLAIFHIFEQARELKKKANQESDPYVKMRKYMLAGSEFIRYATLSHKNLPIEKSVKMWNDFAKFFNQTFSTLPKEAKKRAEIPKRNMLLFSLCLDCEVVLFREVVHLHSDYFHRIGEALKQMRTQLLAQQSPGSSIGSNPPESSYSVLSGDILHPPQILKGDKVNEYVSFTQNCVQMHLLQRKAFEMRKDLCLERKLPSTDGFRAIDLLQYIEIVLKEADRL